MKFLNFLIKPASSLCNLRCKYCFYEDIAENRSEKSLGVMSEDTVDALLAAGFEAIGPRGTISFAFQGGEPTVAGLDFFKNFVSKAKERRSERVSLLWSIQTNGTLLNEDWMEFFKSENFLVGVSVDGYKNLHNLHRVDTQGKDTWNRVTKAVQLLQWHRVPVNALCVVTEQCAKTPERAYNELKKLGFDYLQFIACLDPVGLPHGNLPWSLMPEQYGDFLCRVFDLWYSDWRRGQYTSVRLFEDYVHILLHNGASTCATCGSCGSYFVVEADGSLYPCDFYCFDDWKLGNIKDTPLLELQNGNLHQSFLSRGHRKPAECGECPYGAICNGGCQNDWYEDESGVHNYYCKSFKAFLDHALPGLRTIAQAERAVRGH